MRYCKKKGSAYPAEKKKKCSKPLNTLEQMYIIIGFAFSPLCSCMGNSVACSRVSLTSSVFSISSQQKLAPHWANPHFKELCLSTRDKAHSTHMEAASSLTLKSIASFAGLLAYCLFVFVTQRYGSFIHTVPTQIQHPLWTWCHFYTLEENVCLIEEENILGDRKVGII